MADPKSSEAATSRAAGRGGLAIAVAKVSFIVFGFAQQLILPRVLGVDGYGAVSRMLAIVSIVNNVVVASSLQGVSRAVSGAPEGQAESALRRVLLVHVVLAFALSIGFALVAGVVADAIEAPHLAGPLRLGAGVVLCYGIYAPLVGSLNGRRRFLDQAGLDIFYGISRAALLVLGAYVAVRVLGADGTSGAALGFVAAATLILPIAAWRSGLGKAGPGPTSKEYLAFLLPLALGQVGLNLLLQTDFMILSNTVGKAARLQGLATQEADRVMGIYRGVQLFGFLPYQLLMSVQFVLFPMLVRARADGDEAAVGRYARTGVRLAMVLTGAIAAPIAAIAPHVLRFAFPEAIAAGGADALRILAPGMAAFAILSICATALTSLGREVQSAALTWLTVGLVAAACLLSRPSDAFGKILVDATATATAGAMVAASVVAAVLLRRAAGAFVAPSTLGRVLLAFGATMAAGWFLPWMGKLLVPVQAVAMVCVYLAVLVITRELGRADLSMLTGVVGRRRG